MICFCSPASFSHPFQNPGLAVLAYLRISLFQTLSVGEVFPFKLFMLRRIRLYLDMVLGKRRRVKVLILQACCAEERGIRALRGWRIGSWYGILQVDGSCGIGRHWRIGNLAILQEIRTWELKLRTDVPHPENSRSRTLHTPIA